MLTVNRSIPNILFEHHEFNTVQHFILFSDANLTYYYFEMTFHRLTYCDGILIEFTNFNEREEIMTFQCFVCSGTFSDEIIAINNQCISFSIHFLPEKHSLSFRASISAHKRYIFINSSSIEEDIYQKFFFSTQK